MKTLFRFTFVSMLAGLMAAPPAFAQLEEIIVTATRRAESLQDVPISVTAITGEAIQVGGFSDMEEVSVFVPNLYMADTFTGQVLAVRGIGTSPGNEAFEQAVAQFHDGVYYGRDNLGQNGFFDLERVEVVRGPQPTFAGQSATAGALNYASRRPGDSFEGNLNLAYGTTDETSVEFGIGGPVTDTFGARLAGRYFELGDYWYTQRLTGAKLGIKENLSLRFIADWAPTDNFELMFKYENHDIYQLGTPREKSRCETRPQFSIANPALAPGIPALCALDALYNDMDLNTLTGVTGSGGSQDVYDAIRALNAEIISGPNYVSGVTPLWSGVAENGMRRSPIAENLNDLSQFNEQEDREQDVDIFALSFDWDLGGSGYTLSSTTSLVEYDKHDWLDPDASSFAIVSDERTETFEQTGQELRITSPLDQRLSWMLGTYWQEHELDTEIDVYVGFGVGFGNLLEEESGWQSLFFAGTYNITDQVRLNFGGRYQDVEKTAVFTPSIARPNGNLAAGEATAFGPLNPLFSLTDLSVQTDDVLPEVGLQFDTNENTMLYVKYAEAFKAGGFVMSPAPGGMLPDPISYRPEFAEGVELGAKMLLADGNLEFNVALYNTDYTDLQVNVFISEIATFVTQNAASAHSTGVEFDGRWALSDNLILGFSGSFGEAEYDDYAGQECNTLEDKLYIINNPGARPGACSGVNNAGGQTLANFPKWTLSFTPTYTYDLNANLVGSFGANIVMSDGARTSPDRDPIGVVDDWERVDLRFALAPADANWEFAVYGRNVTDNRRFAGFSSGDFMSRSRDLIFDGGDYVAFERERRFGLQFNYFFGN